MEKMKQKELGLPLEYGQLSEYFDLFSEQCNKDAKNNVIESILKKYSVKTVLDLTCGTGSQLFYLANHGYTVIGADFSQNLLAIAHKKALEEKLDIQCIHGDMRTLQVGTFDAVITIDNAVGHVSKDDFEKTMRNVHSNLKDGGLYVFDIFNAQAMTSKVVDALFMDRLGMQNGIHFHQVQHSAFDGERNLLTSYDRFTLYKEVENQTTLTGEFTLQIYSAQELRDMLVRSGFEVLGQYGMDGLEFIENQTLNILTVAQRQK